MKLAILQAACLLCVAIVACSPIVDRRSDTERAATQTARAVLPLPPLPRTLKIWVLPQPTVDLMPTITPQPTKASE